MKIDIYISRQNQLENWEWRWLVLDVIVFSFWSYQKTLLRMTNQAHITFSAVPYTSSMLYGEKQNVKR